MWRYRRISSAYGGPNLQVYGADKVWHQLQRERIAVARCTVAYGQLR